MKICYCDFCRKKIEPKEYREVRLKIGATDNDPPLYIDIDLCRECRVELICKTVN